MESTATRAAEYVRMSTEHQQYSIANQSVVIQQYASQNSIEIVRTYVDRGKSGLAVEGRPGLQSLLTTVISGVADFELLLVYDVSRWGRFQDVDESAYYEYTLKKAGVRIVYCAEPFRDTGSPTDALIKTLKRAMAAEYSRELSAKVSAGQRRIAELGYRLGGLAGFGFRRVAVDPSGSRRIVLRDGERKGIKTDRVTLARGPKEEVRTVQKVFALFVNDGFGERRISQYLNERGVLTRQGRPWSRETIHRMLINPKYVGDLAYNRTVTTIGSLPVPNARDKWTYVPNRFPAVISRDVWNRAQEVFERRVGRSTEEVMLARLRSLLAKHGRLTYDLIDAEPGMPAAQTYHRHFGSISEAYRRVGWEGSTHRPQITRSPEVRTCRSALEQAVTTKISETADHFQKHPTLPIWTVNGELSIYVALVVATKNDTKRRVWQFRWKANEEGVRSDLIVIARLNAQANAILDYYVLPGSWPLPIRIFDQNPWTVDLHRFEDLNFFDLLCRRTTVSVPGGSDA